MKVPTTKIALGTILVLTVIVAATAARAANCPQDDGRSGRIRRRVWAGRAGDTGSLRKKILSLAGESEASCENEGGIFRPHGDWAGATTCTLTVASV
jgi:hypothetical protein